MYLPKFHAKINVLKEWEVGGDCYCSEIEVAPVSKPLYDLIEKKTGKPVAYLALEKNRETGGIQLYVCYPVGVDGELTQIPVKLSRKEKQTVAATMEDYAAELKEAEQFLAGDALAMGDITEEEYDKRLLEIENNPVSFYIPFYADLKLA